jgi:hypothetical protein
MRPAREARGPPRPPDQGPSAGAPPGGGGWTPGHPGARDKRLRRGWTARAHQAVDALVARSFSHSSHEGGVGCDLSDYEPRARGLRMASTRRLELD